MNATDPSAISPDDSNFPEDLFTTGQRLQGAIALHIIFAVYIFYAIFIICDKYFVPAIEAICKELEIPTDIAGATLMAISTSSPELFTNCVGTFITEGDIGLGTIVGSSIFNVLFVGACCGIFVKSPVVDDTTGVKKFMQGILLEGWSLSRDCFFYIISVIVLIIIIDDQRIYWYEAVSMLLCYILYIFVLRFNAFFKKNLTCAVKQSCCCFVWSRCSCDKETWKNEVPSEQTPLISQDSDEVTRSQSRISVEDAAPMASLNEIQIHQVVQKERKGYADQKTESDGLHCSCWSVWRGAKWLVRFPVGILLTVTIPKAGENWSKINYLTVAMCILWTAGLTYLVSWMVTVIGETLNIPESVTGLTFLAAGTSTPEVISSVIVARRGLGTMGFSNSVGSNTFDILVCLGVPWLIQCIRLLLDPIDGGNFTEINSRGIEYSSMILVVSLLLLCLAIGCNGLALDRKIGFLCIIMYLFFITIACLLETDVISPLI